MPTASRRPRLWEAMFHLRREETGPVLIAALFFFFLLTALMLLRPARDALGLAHGIESVRSLIVVTAVVTLAMNPLFGWVVSRLKRLQFIGATYGFLVLALVGFWGLMRFAPSAVSQASSQVFYIWFNVFNLFVTMVFWALLADRFTSDQGKRFFALIAVGGTLGAIFGPWLTSQLAQPLGTPSLLLVAGGFLLLGMLAAWLLLWIAPDRTTDTDVATSSRADESERIGGSAWAGVLSVFRSPYLIGVAGYVMLTAVMVTFVYFTRLQMVAAIADDLDTRAAILGKIDMWTHVAVLTLQLTLAGRIIKRFGLGVTLAMLPVTTAFGFIGLAIYGSFLGLMLLEVGTRAVQRGIAQPAREALFTVVDRQDKYKAKALIDTFVYRSGDVAGAQAEGALGRLGLAMGGLVSVVLPLALVWGVLALWLGRAQFRRAAQLPASAAPADSDGIHDGAVLSVSHAATSPHPTDTPRTIQAQGGAETLVSPEIACVQREHQEHPSRTRRYSGTLQPPGTRLGAQAHKSIP
ncbi:ATP:ADP antiporter, AAA family [Pseudoxanthomonas wuyuanensis]|uniref:ATP:ADP antiporter, AAA family n=2 Tax=Pseudoxanthomonas wuyuanensis TaxID=1073196 RepID=A0A286CYW3_9GAMM|nr:ATP:ADP antiporter, AAA family [Pseudoxanthomonas wuyuanensis]